jgi:hypothetical protein
MADAVRKLVMGIISEGMNDHYLLEDMANLLIRSLVEENIDDIRSYVGSKPDGTPLILNNEAYFAYCANKLEGSAEKYGAEGVTVADMANTHHDSYVKLIRVKGDKLKKLGTMGSAGGDRFFIQIFYTDAYINYLRTMFSDISELTEDRLHRIFSYTFISPLIHELRHVYDSFRSHGKYVNSKKSKDYFQKYHPLGKEQTTPKTPEQYDDYINLPHEVWARFTQWLQSQGKFYQLDKDKPHVELEGGRRKWFASMRDIKTLIQSLKVYDNMFWDKLSEKDRRRLIKAVINHWNDAKEEVDRYNNKLNSLNSQTKSQ